MLVEPSTKDRLDAQLQRDAGLSHADHEVLVRRAEAPQGSMRMSELAERARFSRSRLSHAVNRLERTGWVRREGSAEDRRGTASAAGPDERGGPVDKVDLKTERRDLYSPPRGRFVEVDVPPMTFLADDGHGDPNTGDAYRHAVEALFAVSYAAKSLSKRELGRDHVVLPLEGLWSATDWTAFERRVKQDWSWTMLIRQPEWVDAALLDRARDGVRARGLPALPLVRTLALAEGRCVQTLHVGSYDDEAPLLRSLHRDHLPERGLVPTGPHHEIYLNDPRRTDPAKLKVVLRQPVARARGVSSEQEHR